MVKYKSWVKDVQRTRAERVTRHGKVRLDKNERVTPLPEGLLEAIKGDITWETITAYPETEPLYDALAEHLGVPPESLMLTAGADGAIRHAFDLFVQPGSEVVVLEPTFAMVDVYCGLFHAQRRAVGYDRDLNLDISGLIAAITANTALVVIANPNSPTGTVIPEDAIREILDHARTFQVPVVIDEAYYGFCSYTTLPLIGEYENLIVGRTFSKAHGLAGLRVGYLVAAADLAQLLYRFRPMYEVNSLGVLAALHILRNPQVTCTYLDETTAGKRFLMDALNLRGIRYCDTQTNFLHIDFGAKKDKMLAALEKARILVRGGLPVPGYEGYLRVSLGPPGPMRHFLEVVDECYSRQGHS